jgi:tRNA A37 threonylcarbamoyladenosine dehydratase
MKTDKLNNNRDELAKKYYNEHIYRAPSSVDHFCVGWDAAMERVELLVEVCEYFVDCFDNLDAKQALAKFRGENE